MLAELLAVGLLRANLAAGLATLAVVGLRNLTARRWGRNATFRLWRAVPITALASVFPGPELLGGSPLVPGSVAAAMDRFAPLVDGVWLLGVVVSIGILAAREATFRKHAARGLAGPATVGVLWPRLVTPADFVQRFTPLQRSLVIAHERAHIARGDTRAGLIIAVGQALAWCNPLVGLAARLSRLDLELACDADVLAARPRLRRTYGETLIAARSSTAVATSCAWRGSHPIEPRLRALAKWQAPASYEGRLYAIDMLSVTAAMLLWACAPTCLTLPSATWASPAHIILIDLQPREATHSGSFVLSRAK